MMNNLGKTKFADRNHPGFNKNAEPFFRIVMEGLKGYVDGEHFWDVVAENAVFEFMYHVPGFTSKIVGRDAYMEWFGGYSVVLQSADGLIVIKAADPKEVVLEYAVHAKGYDNRFCSIVRLKDRKIVHWRDYADSLAMVGG
ncbi:hypothetical protein LJC00_02345 [Dysgonomonas sp. OttesenSCG-928-M03]|nr:hypothetical protein [Dysgonomonas sp. OttesenSCG-928-M03]